MGPRIARDYQAYLRGDLFRDEISFLDNTALRKLHRKRAYTKFIEEIRPYQAIKYIFRRGVFPLLHILHGRRNRTDMGLLRHEYRRIRPALDFMLKAFNVRKTLYITGVWDLNYFIYIMNCPTERRFCELYLAPPTDDHQFRQATDPPPYAGGGVIGISTARPERIEGLQPGPGRAQLRRADRREESFRVIDAALDQGINFVDCADSYSGGKSESVVGQALARDGKRTKVILSSKVFYPGRAGPERPGEQPAAYHHRL